MKITVNVEDAIARKRYKCEIEYNSSTRIKDIFSKIAVEYGSPFLITNEGKILFSVDYYYHKGILYWDEKPQELYVVDFLDRFPEYRRSINVGVSGGLGAVGGPEEFIKGVYDIINTFIIENPLAYAFAGIVAEKLKNWAKQKKCYYFKSFKASIYEKGIWKSNEIKKALEINDDEQIKMLMMSLGYEYIEKEDRFLLKNKI